MSILESDVERRFNSRLKKLEIETVKLNLRGRRGWPDRLVILPGGNVVFIELKSPGGQPRPLQEYVHAKLKDLGHDVQTFDNAEEAASYVESRALGTTRLSEDRGTVVGEEG